MNKLPLVSVVMSNYNGISLNLLERSLSSILKNPYPNLEVLLIDNASTDNSVSFIKKRFGSSPRLKIIQNHVNMYSQGLNLGITNSSGKYIAFFNNDVEVEDNFFHKFVKFLNQHPKIALAQGKLISYFNHSIIDSAGETMDQFGNPITIGQGQNAKEKFNEILEVLSVSGSCSILRKSTVNTIGFFDDDYGIGYEDLDLALRAWLNGYKVVFYPDSIAFHKRGATDLSPMVRAIVRWHFNKNRMATMIKNYPFSFLVTTLPITIMVYLIAGLWEILIKRKISIGITRFTSIIWILDHLPVLLRKRSNIQKQMHKNEFLKIQKMLYKNILLSSFLSFIKIK